MKPVFAHHIVIVVALVFVGLLACSKTNTAKIVAKADKLVADKKTEEAIILYHKALQNSPDEPVLYLNEATLLRQTGRYPQAIRNYEALLTLTPKSPWPYLGLARTYLAQKKYETASQILNDGLDKAGKNGALYFYLGRTFYERGEGEQALDNFNKALDEKYPNLANVYYYRGLTFETLLGNKERAKLDYDSYIMSGGEVFKGDIQNRLKKLDVTQYDF